MGPDSYEDEFGITPGIFDLEDNDPEVEEVFGIEYTQRLRHIMRQAPPPISPPEPGAKAERRAFKAKIKASEAKILAETKTLTEIRARRRAERY